MLAGDALSISPLPVSSTPATTQLELRAWYSIDWSNSLYASVGIGAFLPLLLQSSALDAAGFPSVCGNIVTNATLINMLFPVGNVSSVYYQADFKGWECDDAISPHCVAGYCRGVPATTSECRMRDGLTPFPLRTAGAGGVDPTSYSTASVAVSVAAQAIVFALIGSVADYGHARKRALVWAGIAGGLLCVLCAGITPSTWGLGLPLMVVTNIAFGVSSIMYNAYLPLLVASHSDVTRETNPVARRQRELALGNAWSNTGFAWGYLAGLVGILLCVPAVLTLPEIAAYEVIMVIVGVWWCVFTVIPALYLLPRPGPPLPVAHSYISHSLAQLKSTLRDLRTLRVSGQYLILWMIYSDGVFVIGYIGGLYANSEVQWGCMSKGVGLLLIFFLVPIAAGLGNIIYLRVGEYFKIRAEVLLVASLLCAGIVPAYACLGFIDPRIGYFYGTDLLLVCVWYGFQLGAMQAYSRSIFAMLIPKGREVAFFSLYELTNRGSSWIGPLMLTLVQETLHDLRYGWLFVAVNIIVPAIILLRLDIPLGVKQAEEMGNRDAAAAAAVGATERRMSGAAPAALMDDLAAPAGRASASPHFD